MGHGIMAALGRFHPEYVETTILAQATLHMMRMLFGVGAARAAQGLQSKQAKVDRLRRSRPENFTGRQLFLSDLYSAAASQLALGTKLSNAQRLEFFDTHGPRWAGLLELVK